MSTQPESISENLIDLVEPADAKSKAVEPRKRPFPPPDRPVRHHEPRDSILNAIISARTLGMAPISRRQDFIITYNYLNDYFNQLYEDLIDLIFPTLPAPPNIIPVDDFVAVCKWLVCMRVQYVQRRNYNVLPRYRTIDYRPTFLVPTPLARVLRGLGSCMKMLGAVECAPNVGQARAYTAEEIRTLNADPAAPEALRLIAAIHADPDEVIKVVDEAVILSFTRFVALMHRRGTNYVDSMGDDPNTDHPWYVHGVLRNNVDVANNVATVTIVTFDTNIQPEEALIAAVVQRQFNGQLANGPGIIVESDPITDALGLRSVFNTSC